MCIINDTELTLKYQGCSWKEDTRNGINLTFIKSLYCGVYIIYADQNIMISNDDTHFRSIKESLNIKC